MQTENRHKMENRLNESKTCIKPSQKHNSQNQCQHLFMLFGLLFDIIDN